jgi:hypothetical protein
MLPSKDGMIMKKIEPFNGLPMKCARKDTYHKRTIKGFLQETIVHEGFDVLI